MGLRSFEDELAGIRRREIIRSSPKWKAMLALRHNQDFLDTLGMLREQFLENSDSHQKTMRYKTFECPEEKIISGTSILVSHGFIKLNIIGHASYHPDGEENPDNFYIFNSLGSIDQFSQAKVTFRVYEEKTVKKIEQIKVEDKFVVPEGLLIAHTAMDNVVVRLHKKGVGNVEVGEDKWVETLQFVGNLKEFEACID